jgi:hypothetical protein
MPGNDLPRWIWDIDNAVGFGCPNNRPDVGLIQVLLNKLIRTNDLRDTSSKFNSAPDDPMLGSVHGYRPFDFLEVDGVFGTQTSKVLDAWRKKKFYTPGQIVSPLKHGLEAGRGFPLNYTIYGLNKDFRDTYFRMPNANDAPAWLKPYFV